MRTVAVPKRWPRAKGKPTVSLPGYPAEDGIPMSATEFHGRQISTLSNQLVAFFGFDSNVYVGTDSFIYYVEGDPTKRVAPDVYVVLGVAARPVRRSFYTWAEGAVPTVVFEFLSERTERENRGEKLRRYLEEIGVEEVFLHQPEGSKPLEFEGWRRREGAIEEIPADERGGRYSEALGLWFVPEEQPDGVRLLRPYLPDGRPLPTLQEAQEEAREQAMWRRLVEDWAEEVEKQAQEAERWAKEAERRAREEAQARAEAERRAREEAQARAEAER
ncbi:MAG TPA: Uma2 family endonuclease, partial [Armatimonadetes bacterium]|nr:Uma2 family endonuclease [Armatimonadota bacterium]